MIYMEKAFGAVCFFKSEVDVSQMLLLKASFQDQFSKVNKLPKKEEKKPEEEVSGVNEG